MTDNYQEQFEELRQLRERGDLEGARRLLEGLIVERPQSATLFAVLGDVYWDQGFLDKAISSFRTAARIAPRSEVASLGLFHTLWHDGQEDEAFDEMRRFTSLCESSEYKELIGELNA